MCICQLNYQFCLLQSESQPAGQSSKVSGSNSNVFDDFDDEPAPVKTQPKFRRRVTLPNKSAVVESDPVSTLQVTREHKPVSANQFFYFCSCEQNTGLPVFTM